MNIRTCNYIQSILVLDFFQFVSYRRETFDIVTMLYSQSIKIIKCENSPRCLVQSSHWTTSTIYIATASTVRDFSPIFSLKQVPSHLALVPERRISSCFCGLPKRSRRFLVFRKSPIRATFQFMSITICAQDPGRSSWNPSKSEQGRGSQIADGGVTLDISVRLGWARRL